MFYMNKFLIIILFINLALSANSVETPSNQDLYNREKITFSSERYYDQLYPGDAMDFRFFQGDKEITADQFIVLSQDELLLRNKKMIRDIKVGGFTGAAILGGLSISFLIPSIIFVAVQLNYYNQQVNYQNLGYKSWIEYYNAKYPEYFIPGLTCIVLTTGCILLLLIDLTVTFALLYKYRFNERLYKEAVERYNEKLKAKYGIMPELGFLNDNINLGLKINL
jgi:hypothetical protein